MKSFTQFAYSFTIAAAFTPFAFATTITPGSPSVTATNAITVANDGIVATITGTLTADTFTGSYTEFVIKDGSNPYGVDDLTFLISVANNPGSRNGIEDISTGDGAGTFALFPSVNVGYLAGPGDYGTDSPITIDETIYGTVQFNFTGPDAILPGTGTQYLVIQTAATNFQNGNIAAIDSSSDTVPGYVPSAITAEANSFLLLGTGLASGALFLLRRPRQGHPAL